MTDGNIPYIVPLCFGYEDNTIYVHSSLEGKKIDILKKNKNVCFEFDLNSEIVKGDNSCEWGMKYKSVIGFGKAYFLSKPEDKKNALDIIMKQYSDSPSLFLEKAVNRTSVIKIEIESMTGKQSGL